MLKFSDAEPTLEENSPSISRPMMWRQSVDTALISFCALTSESFEEKYWNPPGMEFGHSIMAMR
jgi:hypothetical protein